MKKSIIAIALFAFFFGGVAHSADLVKRKTLE